ncbi:Glycerophosphoryl diester phosphodiesterase family-domain-containing protein [Lipomyces oligophaga]|uniref:Glycerophosphoryl diester phosphodiesterase family-domain-containing protein n=1 Tax=Lipomyces oligophaga TaxID=45792 RepID=UPI0034CF446B
MKFGKNLPRNQVPEWSSFYLNYKSLKKHIRTARAAATAAGEPDSSPVPESYLTPFFYSLDRNLETVDSFYNQRLTECHRRLKVVLDRFPYPSSGPVDFDHDELEDLVGALLELRSQLRMLQWYAEVNKRGFIKILKKLDKRTGVDEQLRYLESKVLVLPFASGSQANDYMETVNSWLSHLAPDSDAVNELSLIGSGSPVPSQHSSSAQSVALDSIKSAVAADDLDSLKEAIGSLSDYDQLDRTLITALQRAVSARSLACTEFLLTKVNSLADPADIRGRNIFHRHVVALGRQRSSNSDQVNRDFYITPAENPVSTTQLTTVYGSDGVNSNDETSMLRFLLDHITLDQRPALAARDGYKRSPLHYASQYGTKLVARVIIEYLKTWNLFDVPSGLDAPEWVDAEGLTPFHLAVIGKHPKTLRVLLDATADHRPHDSSQLLSLAAKSDSADILSILLESGLNIDFADDQLETPLYVASKFGHAASVKILLDHGANTEICEATYGWTPLFVASVYGYDEVVDLLIASGSDVEKTDGSGWTAMEHACLRGHLRIAEKMPAPQPPHPSPFSMSDASASVDSLLSIASTGSSKLSSSPVNSSISTPPPPPSSTAPPPRADLIKSFGHKYLKNNFSMVLVTLGSTDTRHNTVPVQLDQVPLSRVYSTQLDTALSLVISAQNAIGEPTVIDLPIQDNQSTEPIVFQTTDPSKTRVFFDIVPTYAGNRNLILGRAVAMLSTIRTSVGQSVRSLHETITVPIIQNTTLDILGTVNFEFLVVKPFENPNLSVAKSSTYWKSLTSTRVIGHRGLGKNSTSRKSLQLGENTLQSFIAAANLGASYVEFDVQLTRDRVPVIYHDFVVAETGIDVPMHALTLEQFLNVSELRTPKSNRSRNSSPRRTDSRNSSNHDEPTVPFQGGFSGTSILNAYQPPGRRPRSLSLEMIDDDDDAYSERLKYTNDFKKKGFKGNSRGISIQAPFTTLEEVFRTLPKHVGFNIECKYPMLDESQAENMDDLAIELNEWIDTVLKCVYDHGKGRDIIFSSFHPDVCIMLSLKQPSIPVLFLTESGTEQMADIRASSLQEAIRFACRWNLLGIVSACQPLIISPRLIRVVKESGLVCFSYGTMNNDPDACKLQMNYGVDAVIVDSVLAVRKGLTAAAAYGSPAVVPVGK